MAYDADLTFNYIVFSLQPNIFLNMAGKMVKVMKHDF